MTNPFKLSLALAALCCALAPPPASAQQPFYTEDADVTARGKFYFEFINEFDLLQPDAFPTRQQNTATFVVSYGLLEDVEVSVVAPLITLVNARGETPRTATGVGDASLYVKYNFLKEREDSRRPALAASFSVELPTGDTERQLGSGVADFTLNYILQKSLTRRTTWRLNGGMVASGNTLSGAVGLRTRGVVYTGGTSFVRQFTPRLDLGAEVTGAVTRNFDLGKGQLQTQLGGNYRLRERLTLDFGVLGGRFAASPRLGAQLGFSYEF